MTDLGTVYKGFLSTQEDLTIFVSCVCGTFGIFLLLAVAGFLLDHLGYLKRKGSKKRKQQRKQPNIQNSHQHRGCDSCNNHYPSWMYEKLAKEQKVGVKKDTKLNGVSRKQNNLSGMEDPVHYINEVFSEILQEDAEEKTMGIAYDMPQNYAKPEMNPSFAVAYPKKSQQNLISKESDKERRKILMHTAEAEEQVEKVISSKVVQIEKFDSYQMKKENLEQQGEEKKVAISAKEFAIKAKTKANRNQSVEYENPTLLAKAREEKQSQEIEKQQREERRSTRKVALEPTETIPEAIQPVEAKPIKRIPTEKRTAALEDISEVDDVLY